MTIVQSIFMTFTCEIFNIVLSAKRKANLIFDLCNIKILCAFNVWNIRIILFNVNKTMKMMRKYRFITINCISKIKRITAH